MSSKLTYGHFERTGEQDCENVIELDDFELDSTYSPEEVVAKAMKEWDENGSEAMWIEQHGPIEDFEGLDPHLAYEAWKKGWAACAVGHVRDAMQWTLNKNEKLFFKLLADPDPESTVQAEDLALQHGMKLRTLGEKRAVQQGLADRRHDTNLEHIGVFDNDTYDADKDRAVTWMLDEGRPGTYAITYVTHFCGQTWSTKYPPPRSSFDFAFMKYRDIAAATAWARFKVMKRWPCDGDIELLKETLEAVTERPSYVPEELINPAPARHMRTRANPAPPEARDEERAVDKYREFNRFDPKELVYDTDFKMPTKVKHLAEATEVLYESLKVIPDNLKRPKKPVAYIHEFETDVQVYACDVAGDTDVPSFIQKADALVLLGDCLGFSYKGGHAKVTQPLPELYCTPCGKALLVIQSKKKLLAIFWGGALAVEPRGITG